MFDNRVRNSLMQRYAGSGEKCKVKSEHMGVKSENMAF